MTILNFGIKKVWPYFDILNISKILGFPLWLPAGYNLEEYVFNEKKLLDWFLSTCAWQAIRELI